MPGTSTCARPRSVACITSCPTARSSRSARTTRCTARATWTGRARRRTTGAPPCPWPAQARQVTVRAPPTGRPEADDDDLPAVGAAVAWVARLPRAARLRRGAALQHGHARLLRQADVHVCAPARGIRPASRRAGQRGRGSPRRRYAVLHLYGRAALPGHARGRPTAGAGGLLLALLAHDQSGRRDPVGGGLWLAHRPLLRQRLPAGRRRRRLGAGARAPRAGAARLPVDRGGRRGRDSSPGCPETGECSGRTVDAAVAS